MTIAKTSTLSNRIRHDYDLILLWETLYEHVRINIIFTYIFIELFDLLINILQFAGHLLI